MSAGDIIITIIIWLYRHTLLPILPTQITFLPIATYQSTLQGLEGNLAYAFSGVNKLFPLELLLGVVLTIITAELILFLVKIAMFVINVVRGSGA